MKHKFLLIYTWFVRTILFFFPDIPIIMRFRGWLYGLGMKSCGRDFQVTHDARITGLESIVIGRNCFIGNGTLIIAAGNITLEDEVQIGPFSVLISDNHTICNGSYRYGKISIGTIRLCKGSWVAANCTITNHSQLPEGSVLGANSVLNKEYSDKFSLYGGVPAKYKKAVNSK